MAQFIKKYKHGLIILVYAIVYLMFFGYLEHRPVRGFHAIDTVFDDYIPFYQLVFNMMMGMTIFLIVSYVYPNVLHLRPLEFPRENVFTDAVRWLYRTDTPTNVLPSIHVFNSLAIHMSLTNCEALRDKKAIRYGSLVLTLLIIMSTMFLKQHSVIDVCCGATLALFGYLFFYPQKAGEEARDVAVERFGRNKRGKRY